MNVGGRRIRRGHLAAAASGLGLLGVVVAHRGSPPLMPVALPARPAKPAPTTTSPAGRATTSTTTPPGRTSTPTSAVGAAEQFGFGVLSVKVTVSGGRIVDVQVAQYQAAEQYSASLAQQVVPMLRGEVLSAQSAQINAVSGATYTSQAYAASVQSALDQLHM